MNELKPCPLCNSENIQLMQPFFDGYSPDCLCMKCGCKADKKAWQNRTQSQWISVDSCLPEYKGMYLTFWTDGSLETYNFSKERCDLGWYQPLINQQITHWANLPLPPKEQGQ